MSLKDALGISGLKIYPDCGDIGPRLINRCPDCEALYQESENKRKEREAAQNKMRERRASGFGPEWD